MLATGLTQVIGIDRVSSFNYYRQTSINGKLLRDYSHLVSAIFILDATGNLVKKENFDTSIDRAFRFIHNIDTGEYALIEVSHKDFITNPDSWADGVIIGGKLIKNALFTDYDGNLLSSIFYDPESNKFLLKTDGQFNKEFLSYNTVQENKQEYGIRMLISFSKSDTNRHLNGLYPVQLINPVFAPESSIYHYKLPVLTNYFESIDVNTLMDYKSQISAVKSREYQTFKPIENAPPDLITKEQLFQAFLKLFDLKTVFSPKTARGTTTETINDQFVTSLLGELNMIFNPENGRIDSNSKRTVRDVEGVINKIFDTDEEIKEFLFIKEKDGELIPVHKNDYQKGYVSTTKQWLKMLFDKIANIPYTALGTDRVSNLLKEARNNLRDLRDNPNDVNENPLNINHIDGKNNERDFALSELDDGKTIYSIVSRLFGHVTLRFIFFHMLNYYSGQYLSLVGRIENGFKLDITTRRTLDEMVGFLDQFKIKSPNQDKPKETLRDLRGRKWKLHMLPFFFGNSHMHLPVESGNINEDNKVQFGYSPLPFITKNLRSINIDLEINNWFWSQYNSYLKFLYDNQGPTSKLHLFVLSGKNLLEVITNKLDKYGNIPALSEGFIQQLIDSAKVEVFRTHTNVGYEGEDYDSIRFQIEKFLKSDDYSREIIFYRVLNENGKPFRFEFTKDEFRGYFVIIFGKVKSVQFSQREVNNLLNSGFHFQFK
jgi:hypothetical protein